MKKPEIQAIDPAAAAGQAKHLLDAVQAKLGTVPNLMRTLAHSPAALEAYLHSNEILAQGVLPARFREQIAILVAQLNGCQYCLSAHAFLGRLAGLASAEIEAARRAESPDAKIAAGLGFARTLVMTRGDAGAEALRSLRQAAYGDAEILEIIAHVALNIYTNYVNMTAETEVDFPIVGLEMAAGNR